MLLLAIVGGSALALLSWTQPWYQVELTPASGHAGQLTVSGVVAAPAITALALAGIALAGALAIAGVILRMVFGVLQALLGVCVFLSAVLAQRSPAVASSSAITEATGVSGPQSVLAIIESTSSSPWPFVAMIASVLMVGAGAGILVTARRWPGSSRRYQAVGFEDAPERSGEAGSTPATLQEAPEDSVTTWDDLSKGSDPTR